MNHCSQCGASVTLRIPLGDNRERHVCTVCDYVHYSNPRIVAGALLTHDDKILLCRRAIEPRYGYWTLPAGFMENGETMEQAAARETLEEACAQAQLEGLYTLFNLIHINQVHIFYRGTLKDGVFGVGEESLESKLLSKDEIPWDDLAFATTKRTLELFFDDQQQGGFPVHVEDIMVPLASRRLKTD